MIYQFETNVEFCLGSISAFLEFEIILNIKKKLCIFPGPILGKINGRG